MRSSSGTVIDARPDRTSHPHPPVGSWPAVRGDQTLRLLLEGYPYGSRRFERTGADAFRTRLAGRPVLFLRGAEAARFFYEADRFTRTAALPPTVLHSLQDTGSVQTLDGDAHRVRKELFLEVLDAPERDRMVEVFRDEWLQSLQSWAAADSIPLHEAVAGVLTRTACRWAGVPLSPDESTRRTAEFLAMIDGAGAFGPRNWRGLALRHRTERWAQRALTAVDADSESVAGRLRRHRDADGSPLTIPTAAIELLNLLRPTVAVARFITYAALALHQHPDWERAFAGGDESDLRGFVQEVRRCAPFFPLVGGRATRELEWQGHRIGTGSWAMLDIFATNRDGRLWPEPLSFRPERHRGANPHADALIAQGAGDYADGHRCPGEPATIELMAEAVRLLTRQMSYEVPAQDLSVDLRRFPTQPRSGVVIRHVAPR